MRSMFKMLCEGEALPLFSMAWDLPEVLIVGDDRSEGGRGGSIADETITDRAKTMAMTERGIRR